MHPIIPSGLCNVEHSEVGSGTDRAKCNCGEREALLKPTLNNTYLYTMAQSFPYFSSSTPPPSSRISSASQIQQSIPGSSKRDSTLSSSTSTQNVNVNVNRQSSLHQQLFAQQHQQGGILDRPLNRSKGSEVSSGAWAFMFAEIVSYSQSRVDSVTDLEKRWAFYFNLPKTFLASEEYI